MYNWGRCCCTSSYFSKGLLWQVTHWITCARKNAHRCMHTNNAHVACHNLSCWPDSTCLISMCWGDPNEHMRWGDPNEHSLKCWLKQTRIQPKTSQFSLWHSKVSSSFLFLFFLSSVSAVTWMGLWHKHRQPAHSLCRYMVTITHIATHTWSPSHSHPYMVTITHIATHTRSPSHTATHTWSPSHTYPPIHDHHHTQPPIHGHHHTATHTWSPSHTATYTWSPPHSHPYRITITHSHPYKITITHSHPYMITITHISRCTSPAVCWVCPVSVSKHLSPSDEARTALRKEASPPPQSLS